MSSEVERSLNDVVVAAAVAGGRLVFVRRMCLPLVTAAATTVTGRFLDFARNDKAGKPNQSPAIDIMPML